MADLSCAAKQWRVNPDQELPKHNDKPADMSKPVQVFILMGQSNMLGMGNVRGMDEGSLEYAIRHKKRFTHLIDDDETCKWATRKNVRNVHVMPGKGKMDVKRNEWLSVKGPKIGPDLQFGWIMGELFSISNDDEDDESGNYPILILKSCIGNRSLGWDLLPPLSERYEHDGHVYAGYKESPDKWKCGTDQPPPIKWYAGKQYDDDVAHAKYVLDHLDTFYPGATNYEIAGFVFWQGHKDTTNKSHAMRYEQNLVRFIQSLRTDFEAPNAKFVCATVGFGGMEMKGNTLTVCNAQLAVDGDSGKYPEFQGNVKTVDIRKSWRNPTKQGHHYGLHAETFMEVGNALGWAMADLIKNH